MSTRARASRAAPRAFALALALSLVGCGGAAPPRSAGSGGGDDRSRGEDFGPLEVGADWASYMKMNTAPVRSAPHGRRLVDTYVNTAGAAAYLDDTAEIPVGTIVVKTSWEADGAPGPIFVMEKRAPGFDRERGDWYFAIHWADPPAAWRQRQGGPIYWRTPSPRVDYCFDCHDAYDRGLGGVPAEQRIPALP